MTIREQDRLKKEILALALNKFGRKMRLDENKRALTLSEKQQVREERSRLIAMRQNIRDERRSVYLAGDPYDTLTRAARFALDVDGDEPSWSQLALAVATAERAIALREEETEIDSKLRAPLRLHLRRWELAYTDNLGFRIVSVDADTLEELLKKCQ